MLRAMDFGELDRNLDINLFVNLGSLALAASLVRKRWPCLVSTHWTDDANGGVGRGWWSFHGDAIENDSCPLPMPPDVAIKAAGAQHTTVAIQCLLCCVRANGVEPYLGLSFDWAFHLIESIELQVL